MSKDPTNECGSGAGCCYMAATIDNLTEKLELCRMQNEKLRKALKNFTNYNYTGYAGAVIAKEAISSEYPGESDAVG